MFNLQGSELVIILLLALVVLGPEKLPDAMRKMGQFYAELKKMSSGFQQEFRSVVDEPLREVRDTANMLRDSADFTKLQDGERDEKPKSAEMAAVADTPSTPVDEVPTFEGGSAEPDTVAEGGDADAGDADGSPGEPRPDPFATSAGFSAAPAVRESDPATDGGDADESPGEQRGDPFASSAGFSAAPAVRESDPATDGGDAGTDGAESGASETAAAATPAMKPFPSLTPFAGTSDVSADADDTAGTAEPGHHEAASEVEERVAGDPSDRGSTE